MTKRKNKNRDALYIATLFGTISLLVSLTVLVWFPQSKGFYLRGVPYQNHPTWTGFLAIAILNYFIAIFVYLSLKIPKKLPAGVWIIAAFYTFALAAAFLNPVTRSEPLMLVFPILLAAASILLLWPKRWTRLFAAGVFTVNLLYVGVVLGMLIFSSVYWGMVESKRMFLLAGFQLLVTSLIVYYLTRGKMKLIYDS